MSGILQLPEGEASTVSSMAFRTHFIDITQFSPDPASFNMERDLIRLDFEDPQQKLYVSLLGDWAIRHDDPTMPISLAQQLEKVHNRFREPSGIRIDRAMVGQQALFSVLGRSDTNLWRSERAITQLIPITRTTRLRSRLELASRR